MWKEIYFKELAHVIMEATNSADSASQFVTEGQQTAVSLGRADVPIQRLSAGEFSVTQGKGNI